MEPEPRGTHCLHTTTNDGRMNRRTFLTTTAAATVALATQTAAQEKTEFRTRGIVIMPADVPGMGWPARCAKAGIHTIALHEFHAWPLLRFVLDREGQSFLAQCREHQIEVEYELHLMSDLLERWRFEGGERDLFRMDHQGQRNPDVNLCVSNDRALGIVAQNAAALSRILKPTTGRHFYWGDDGGRWCQCPQCRDLSDSDQALIVENHILAELRKDDPTAQLAHLAYHSTLPAPTHVKPAPGVFLEFAPIDRAYAGHLGKPFVRLNQRDNRPRPKDFSNGELLDFLDANLTVFPAATAQALEYWLDVSVLSVGSPTPRLLQLDPVVLGDDLAEYAQRGLRHITTFAVQMNATYLQHHPDPQPMLDVFGKSFADA